MDEFSFYFIIGMSKTAELSVLAFVDFIRILRTKLLLILVFSIQLFDVIVRLLALVAVRTETFLFYICTTSVINSQRSSE